MTLQDYAEFFDALEHEQLYDCLGLDVPELEEVEFSKKYQPEEKVVFLVTTEKTGWCSNVLDVLGSG